MTGEIKKKSKLPLSRFIFEMYLEARDLEDQTEAHRIADEYGIDYEFPVITPKTIKNIELGISRLKEYQERQKLKDIIKEVLKESGLI